MNLTHFSLFSGIGGIDLSAEWAGFTTVGQCEYADYPTKVLEKHWPDVPRWRDIRSVTKESFTERTGLQTVDLISGGFPCQPFSVAGKRKGKDDDRFLWPEMLRVMSEIRPAWVLGENVAGFESMVQFDSAPPVDNEGNARGEIGEIYSRMGRFISDEVLASLEKIGYEVWSSLIPACGVGALHQRKRVFIVAYNQSGGIRKLSVCARGSRKKGYDADRKGQNVADTDNTGLQGRERGELQECSGERVAWQGRAYVADTASAMLQGTTGEQNWKNDTYKQEWDLWGESTGRSNWWSVEPDVGRVANGVPSRVDRLKCLGNAVVPQQVYPILKAIAEIESQ